MTKKEIRKVLLEKRQEIEGRIEKDIEIYKKLSSFLESYVFESVFCYVSMRGEADTHKFLLGNYETGNIYVPFVSEGKMIPRKLLSPSFETDKLGNIPEMFMGETKKECDITIVPLVGFNQKCGRLGYGGGYYDRYLSGCRTFCIGLAYDEQLSAELPVGGNDYPMDVIITPLNIYSGGRDKQ